MMIPYCGYYNRISVNKKENLMKKLLNSMVLFASVLTSLNVFAMQPPRPAVYYLIDSLVANPFDIDWDNVFAVLDKMQGTISVNAYRMTDSDSSLMSLALLDNGNLLAAKKLIEKYGANPNTTMLQTPLLIWAIVEENLPMIQLLLKYGANPYLKDSYGQDSFYHAYEGSDDTTIHELFEAYAKYRNPLQ